MLQTRSGLVSKQDTLEQLAAVVAYYQNAALSAWRPLEDITNDPLISQGRRPLPWPNYQGSILGYYQLSSLLWLDVDQLIREKTGGSKSLDDFARSFSAAATATGAW